MFGSNKDPKKNPVTKGSSEDKTSNYSDLVSPLVASEGGGLWQQLETPRQTIHESVDTEYE